MKKIIFLLVALLSVNFYMYAQKPEKKESRGEQIKAFKVAFITEELSLTSKEAEKFWPVYNKFDSLLHQLERVEKFKLMTRIKKAGGIDNISEKEATSIMKKMAEIDKQVFNTKIEFDNKLAKSLSYKKILKLKIVEREFVRNLMRKYRKPKKNKK